MAKNVLNYLCGRGFPNIGNSAMPLMYQRNFFPSPNGPAAEQGSQAFALALFASLNAGQWLGHQCIELRAQNLD
jgi:hypothetical protein